ncbi:MAG: response regulator transcription factor [Anaerolineales bacterium]|nr:response regulator transcription factor [Anaerolineales bacterium]
MLSPKKHILVVDDEPNIREVVELYLRREGFEVEVAGDGAAALAAVERKIPDLIVLDLMLPVLGGLQVTRVLRQGEQSIPIIMLTAKGEEADRIAGLELGADDYLAKPFSPKELVARVKAVLRRASANPLVDPQAQPLSSGDITLNPATRQVWLKDKAEVMLTAKEFDLLWFLMNHPGQVFTRDQLLDRVWGYDFFGDASTVTVHVRRLREKIERDATKPEYVLTVWGVGYKFRVDDR